MLNEIDNILVRLQTLQQSHLETLKKGNSQATEANAELLAKAVSETEEFNVLISSLKTIRAAEQAVIGKNVLLVESDKKQQALARMALAGTGLILQVAASIDEGKEYLEKEQFDIICVNMEMIELIPKATEIQPGIQSVLMTNKGAPSYFRILRKYPFINNIVLRNDEDRTFTLKNFIVTISKLITKDYFGLEKYLSWGVTIQEQLINHSEQRDKAIAEMEQHFSNQGLRRTQLSKCSLVVEEMLMNAIYDAPVDDSGKPLYNHVNRTVPVSLSKGQEAKLRYACDGFLIAVSVSDPFGALKQDTVLEYLEKCYAGNFDNDMEKGGAGRGLFLMMESSDLLVININKDICTEFIVIFNIDPNKPKLEYSMSFHNFFV